MPGPDRFPPSSYFRHGLMGPGGAYRIEGIPGPTTVLRGDQRWVPISSLLEPFPVGFIYLSLVSTNPATLLGYGTWEAMGAGRFLVGLDPNDPDFNPVGKTGGEKAHILTPEEVP